ncbi:MAG: HAMP domain-containing sensor histidine kinase [Eubacteriales bacterium]|nr:HAMP domain-containing sensor histidine kinase [Eubacteriales bacterium]
MIKTLRKKFIHIAALSLLSVILLLVLSINGIFVYQRNQLLNSRLESLLSEQKPSESSDSGPDSDGKKIPHETGQEKPQKNEPYYLFPQFLGNLKFSAKGCLIRLDENSEIKDVRRDIAESYTDEELRDFISAILSAKSSAGWEGSYKFRKEIHTDTDGSSETLIAIVDASSALHAVSSLLFFSLLIGLVSFLLVLVFIVIASGKVIHPIVESYEKQKQFVTDAGHELKTPLTAISADNELARLTYGDSEWFDAIDRQVQKLSNLVADLIAMAKMDEEQKIYFSNFNISDAVYDTVSSFNAPAATQGKSLTVHIKENLYFSGDEAKIRQLVSILMDNALKYCDPSGEINVRLTGGRHIHLYITNSFCSAEEFDPQKVFERFYRSDKARSSDGSYGLGLSIAKSITELHKGTIHGKTLGNNMVQFVVQL